MAKLLDLLVAAEGFVPVAGRVYAQDGDGDVWWYSDVKVVYDECLDWWKGDGFGWPGDFERDLQLADDHAIAIITAESIQGVRACL